ncbi:MAG: hypothetical protein ACFFGZ_09370 [Candidatus Thorarchaeota archaeon]
MPAFLSPQLPSDRIKDCRGCKACAEHCPAQAICFHSSSDFEVSREACYAYISTTEDGECWVCSEKCYNNVIKMELFEIEVDSEGKRVEVRQE